MVSCKQTQCSSMPVSSCKPVADTEPFNKDTRPAKVSTCLGQTAELFLDWATTDIKPRSIIQTYQPEGTCAIRNRHRHSVWKKKKQKSLPSISLLRTTWAG